jgi:peptidoglycan/LPS O-acetylase OafA/YrhL
LRGIRKSQEFAQSGASPREHIVQLDGLRAFAALSVIVQHFTYLDTYSRFPVGIAGVWLFFVLSGFLITGILLKARDYARGDRGRLGEAWRAFYIRRILRIFPLYYFVLFGAAMLGLPGVRQRVFWYAAHLANIVGSTSVGNAEPLPHFWSLAVEEQFYLVWPTIVLLAPRRWVIGTSVAMAVLAPISRYLVLTATGSWSTAHALPPGCLDGLGMGALLAISREADVSSGFRDRFCRVGGLAGLAILIGVQASHLLDIGYRLPLAMSYSGYSLVSLWLVNRAADGFRGPARRLLEAAPLVYLGKISYGIYIFHMIVPYLIEWFRQRTGYGLGYPDQPGFFRFLYVGAVTILLATITWNLFERPLNDLKRFFPYKGRTSGPRRDFAVPEPVAMDISPRPLVD